MLTNKKMGVLIIMLSLLFVSCGVDNTEKEVNKDTVKVVTGKKDKALGGEALQGNTNALISNTEGNTSSQGPDIIK